MEKVMKPDEAITDLSIQLEVKRKLGKDHQADALKLGIEGLERIVYLRKDMDCPHWMTLPSETEE